MSEQPFSHTPEQSVQALEQKSIGSFQYEVDEDDGAFVFEDVNIGGEVNGEDFRDFIVNHERVGIRMDSTLTLPKETSFSVLSNGNVEFTLPRSKQRGRISTNGGATYVTPITS